jgi:enamine deaminase RidA (YjgF/YER057c/UK114 family)
MQRAQAPLKLRYADQSTTYELLVRTDHILGVVGYGTERPDALPPACPFVAAPLLPLYGGPVFEIWTAASPTRPCQIGQIFGACSGELVFGGVQLEEGGGAALEDVVGKAYDEIFNFLEKTGFHEPIRFWNYLTAITEDEQGLERYKRFNIGRHGAFLTRLRQAVPPAASCLGAHEGASMIYFLAARTPARAIENPRQVSAYAYPPVYGPQSPSFSRAGLHAQDGAETLFISGTASIVGHETRHHGDLHGQVAETIENLRALVANSGRNISLVPSEDWALKIYLRDPLYHEAVETALTAAFGAGSQRLYLHADICRSDLLIEIEALQHAAIGI